MCMVLMRFSASKRYWNSTANRATIEMCFSSYRACSASEPSATYSWYACETPRSVCVSKDLIFLWQFSFQRIRPRKAVEGPIHLQWRVDEGKSLRTIFGLEICLKDTGAGSETGWGPANRRSPTRALTQEAGQDDAVELESAGKSHGNRRGYTESIMARIPKNLEDESRP